MEDTKILVVIPVCPKDVHLALDVLEWMIEMGQPKTHNLVLSTSGLSDQEVGSLSEKAAQIFLETAHVSFPDDAAHMPWPVPHNQQFGRTARVLSMRRKKSPKGWVGRTQTHFFWMEPDATPLVPNWLDVFEAQLQVALKQGKWFMGDYVRVPRDDPRTANTPDHMSGVSVYPVLLSHFSQTAVTSYHAAWDIASASEVIPQAYFTKAIHHVYWEPTFKKQRCLDMIRNEAVVFHQCKDGTLTKVLRQQRRTRLKDGPVEMVKPAGKGKRYNITPEMAQTLWDDWHVRKLTHAEIGVKHKVTRYITRKVLTDPDKYGVTRPTRDET